MSDDASPLSWPAAWLAPLPIPFAAAVALVFLLPGGPPWFSFAIFLALGAILSYGLTWFVFLPCLWVVARGRPLTATNAGVCGALVGALQYFPATWLLHASSGDNSGPPAIGYGDYLLRYGAEPAWWLLPLAGGLTGLLYRLFQRRFSARRAPRAIA